MACEAARKATWRVLRAARQDLSAAEAWDRIGWWTPATIEEALNELVAMREAVRVPDGSYKAIR